MSSAGDPDPSADTGKNSPPAVPNDGEPTSLERRTPMRAATSSPQRRTGGHRMPVTRIAIREGKTPEHKEALMDEIYEAMRETLDIKDGDRFMAITEHGEHEFAYGPFLGIDRDDDLVQIQVFWAPGKAVDAKRAMYKRIVERLGTNPGVRAEDVLISVVETAADNWSFGNGETQFSQPAASSS
jgi:4-oxalocrotonate tautomerase